MLGTVLDKCWESKVNLSKISKYPKPCFAYTNLIQKPYVIVSRFFQLGAHNLLWMHVFSCSVFGLLPYCKREQEDAGPWGFFFGSQILMTEHFRVFLSSTVLLPPFFREWGLSTENSLLSLSVWCLLCMFSGGALEKHTLPKLFFQWYPFVMWNSVA